MVFYVLTWVVVDLAFGGIFFTLLSLIVLIPLVTAGFLLYATLFPSGFKDPFPTSFPESFPGMVTRQDKKVYDRFISLWQEYETEITHFEDLVMELAVANNKEDSVEAVFRKFRRSRLFLAYKYPHIMLAPYSHIHTHRLIMERTAAGIMRCQLRNVMGDEFFPDWEYLYDTLKETVIAHDALVTLHARRQEKPIDLPANARLMVEVS